MGGGLTLPGWRDWLFSAKTFAAAMLALYIALAFELPNPYWAMATVYVVAHPLGGATRSKAIYRAAGTVIGAAAAVFFVPLFIHAPLLLSAVIALWTGSLLGLSMLDRSPRSYVFMLAAYSLPMIALPAVDTPLAVFDLAVARSEEILIGIGCASLVSALFFPGRVAPVLGARVDHWLAHAADWAADTLGSAAGHAPARASGRPALAADILALDQFISHLAYDSTREALTGTAHELRGRMSMLLPVLSSLTATVDALRRQPGGVPADLAQQMDEVADWMQRTDRAPAEAGRLVAQLQSAGQAASREQGWSALLVDQTRARLITLTRLWQDCLALRRMIADERPDRQWQPAYRRAGTAMQARHRDAGMMLYAILSASLVTFLACIGWVEMGWADGAQAVIMTAIASCFFAAQDEPAPLVRVFLLAGSIGMVIASVMQFLIIPLAHEFETLVALLAPLFLLIGTLSTQPRYSMLAAILAVNTASFVGIQHAYLTDAAGFINASLAGVAGMMLALVWTRLTRPFGVDLALRRIVRAGREDLAHKAAGRHDGDYAALTARMFDRLGLTLTRLATRSADAAPDGLADLRAGFAVLDLQRAGRRLDGATRSALERVLAAVERHYRHLADHPHAAQPDPRLAFDINATLDAALDAARQAAGPAARAARHALTELKLTLCPPAAVGIPDTSLPPAEVAHAG